MNLPNNPWIRSALPIQEVNYGSANILAQTFPFRHTVVFTSWIGKAGQRGEICRESPINKAVASGKNTFFTQKLHIQMANGHRSPQSQTNTQPMPFFWPTSFFVTIYLSVRRPLEIGFELLYYTKTELRININEDMTDFMPHVYQLQFSIFLSFWDRLALTKTTFCIIFTIEDGYFYNFIVLMLIGI